MTRRLEAEKLIKLVKPYPVKYLYKYRTMGSMGIQDIFQKRKVFLNDATKFNDPFESKPLLTVDGGLLERRSFLKELTRERFPSANRAEIRKQMRGKDKLFKDQDKLRDVSNRFVASVGIYCLSEKKDDLLMWAHYSDAHRGLCLEFDTSIEGSLFWEAFAIAYQQDYPIVNIMRIGEAEEFRKALLTKSEHWAYEHEWRVLKTKEEGGVGDHFFPPKALSGVVFGALMNSGDKEILKSWIESYPSEITIYEAVLNMHRYQLDIIKA
jgi:hypothetical protein